MPETQPTDIVAFTPYGGGYGIRITCTTSPSAPVGIPGALAASVRFRVVNGGSVSAFIRIDPGSYANTDCLEILPGTVEIINVPSNPNGLTVSGVTASGTTTVSIVAGSGT